MRSMLKTILTLLFALWATTTRAEHPMPDMPQNMLVEMHGACDDHETGEHGYCVIYRQDDATGWLVFLQDEQVMFIRHLFTNKPYEQVWTADRFNSF